MSQESNALTKPSVKVRGWVDPFHPQATAFGCVAAGTTIADAISKACRLARTRKRYQRRGLVYLGRKTAQGDYKWTRIPQSAWNKVRLKPNDSLTFRLLPEGGGGGKNPLRAILNIVVMAVAVVAAFATAGAGLFAVGAGMGFMGTTVSLGGFIAGALVGGLVQTMGQMLVDKIAPIKQPSISTTSADNDDVYSLSGSSNAIDKWGYVPILFGKGCFAPKKAAAPYTELNGDDMYLHELFIWGECGSGDIKISNIKLGDTLVSEYDDVQIQTWRFDPNNPKYSKYYPTGVKQEDFNLLVKNKDEDTGSTTNWIQRTTGEKASSISIDLMFSTLVKFDDKGNAKNCSVTFRIQYRKVGTTTWLDSYNKGKLDYTITAKSTSAVRRTFYLTEEDGTRVGDEISAYDVRIRRVTADHDSEEKEDTKIQDEGYWTALRTHTSDKPININYPVVLTAVRIRATDQLNGSISNLTGEYQVKMKNYNQSTKKWEMTETRDLIPAIRFALQECSARPQPDSVIDWDNFIETDAYWKSLGWKYDKVLDSQTSVLNMIQDICAAGLASPTFIDGKWAVIVDKPRDEVVMGITSANSWGWTVDRVTSELPDIIQCDFINENSWQSDMIEVEVNSQYIEEGRAPVFEKVTFDGVTIPDNVYKHARFHYADAKTQVRTISMTMWDESLIATRGDLVALSQPYLIPSGLESGRIKSVTTNENGYVTKVTTDIYNTVGDEQNLGIKVYLNDGSIAHAKFKNNTPETSVKVLEFEEPITAHIERGNKYTLGYYEEEDFLGVITSMKFNADLTCQLTCIDYVEYKYEVLDRYFEIPPFKSVISKPISAVTSLSPAPVVVETITDERALIKVGDTIKSRAMFRFGVPSTIDKRAVTLRGQCRVHNTLEDDTEIISGKWVTFMNSPISETVGYCDDVEDGEVYDFRFQYVSADGKSSKWKTVENVTVIGKTSNPPVIGEIEYTVDPTRGINLKWSSVNVLDIDHYSVVGTSICDIPTSPDSISEAAAIKTIDNQLWIMPHGAVGVLQFGVYAVDTLGNMSDTVTTITIDAVPPKNPVPVFTPTPEGGVITWEDCKSLWDISHYVVEDEYNNYMHTTVDRYISLTPRMAGSDYNFNIQAVDIYGNTSEIVNIGFTVDNPVAPVPTASIKDDAIAITWPKVNHLYQIDRYEVYDINKLSTPLGSVKGTEFTVSAPLNTVAGKVITLNYRVYAVDIVGNKSAGADCSITINPPASPSNVVASKNGSMLDITWEPSVSDITVSTYRVEHYAIDPFSGKFIIAPYTLGTFDTTFVSIPAVVAGEHIFNIYAINKCGTESITAEDENGNKRMCSFTSERPAPIKFEDCSPVDNNVMMRYTVDRDKIFWPTREYRVFDVEYLADGSPVTAEIGRTDTQFFADIKMQGGNYVYGITVVDVAGNESDLVTQSVTVNQPPNFILYTDKNSTFNGTKTNMLMDGVGGMYGPIEWDDTWATNVSRVASLIGKTENTVTWQDKVDNNMSYFFSPESSSEGLVGKYVETIDVGTTVPSSNIIVTVTSNTLSGSPTMVQTIETSLDEQTWTFVDSTGKALSKDFRYARITLEWTGGLVYVDDIHFQLSSSEINDAGSVTFTSSDYAKDDPQVDATDTEPIGKVVYFNKDFVDIIAFTGLTVRGADRKSAYLIFKDNPRQKWFRVFILDKDGNRTSGQVDWAVKGV